MADSNEDDLKSFKGRGYLLRSGWQVVKPQGIVLCLQQAASGLLEDGTVP